MLAIIQTGSVTPTRNTITVEGDIAGTISIFLGGVSIGSADSCTFSIGSGSTAALTLNGVNFLTSGSVFAGWKRNRLFRRCRCRRLVLRIHRNSRVLCGYVNGDFGPNDTITREQAMTMIAPQDSFTRAELAVMLERLLKNRGLFDITTAFNS